VQIVEEKFNGDPNLTIMLAFSNVLRDMQGEQRDEVATRAALLETTFGDKALSSDSFWAAIMKADKPHFDRLMRRAGRIETKFGN
jgi:hypothetical protein